MPTPRLAGGFYFCNKDKSVVKQIWMTLVSVFIMLASSAVMADSTLRLDDAIMQGNEDAAWVLVEFTDLHCPFCAKFHRTSWPAVKQGYIDNGKIAFAALDYPLDTLHPNAKIASLLLRCAAMQTEYDPVKAFLFANAQLSNQVISNLVATFNLSADKFKACLGSSEQQQAIQRNIAMGKQLGVQVTPAFILGKKQGNLVTEPVLFYGALSAQEFSDKLSKLMQ